MAKFRATTRSRAAERAARVARLLSKPRVEIKVSATSGRTEARNILALRDNAKRGRQVIFETPAEIKALNQKLAGPLKAVAQERGKIAAVAEVAGQALVELYRSHFEQQKFKGGAEPLDPEYAKQKSGRLMDETGALKRSLRFVVKNA